MKYFKGLFLNHELNKDPSITFLCEQTVMKKLEDATNNTKTWKHKVAEHEGMLRLIQPGNNNNNRKNNLRPFVQWVTLRGRAGFYDYG